MLLGTGDGGLAAKTDYAAGDGPLWVALGDLNGDGKLDLAVVNATAETVSVLLGMGDGKLAAPVDYPAGPDPLVGHAGRSERRRKA